MRNGCDRAIKITPTCLHVVGEEWKRGKLFLRRPIPCLDWYFYSLNKVTVFDVEPRQNPKIIFAKVGQDKYLKNKFLVNY